jgi:hypothetical protein
MQASTSTQHYIHRDSALTQDLKATPSGAPGKCGPADKSDKAGRDGAAMSPIGCATSAGFAQ